MAINKAALDLIIEFESVRLEAYPDPAHGWNVPTIGIGHTSAAGPPQVFRGQTITAGEAHDILARDLAAVELLVRNLITVPLTDNQLGALVSFTFNLGAGNLKSSTLRRKLNAGDYAGAQAEFYKWDHANGMKLKGLTRRRAAEAALFGATAAGTVSGTIPQPGPSLPPAGQETGISTLFRAILSAIAAMFGKRG